LEKDSTEATVSGPSKVNRWKAIFPPAQWVKVIVQCAEYCGWALARSHARAGRPALIAGYLGKGGPFDEAIADFATAYAEQNERDYEVMMSAARKGRIEIYTES